MAMPTGVTSARAVSKLSSSVSCAHTSCSSKLVRRRGRGSLVRSRAFVWSKQDLVLLHEMSKRPRHEIPSDVVEYNSLPNSLSPSASRDTSVSTEAEDANLTTLSHFQGAVDQSDVEMDSSREDSPTSSVVAIANSSHNQSFLPSITPTNPALQRVYKTPRGLSRNQSDSRLSFRLHQFTPQRPSAAAAALNPNLPAISGVTSTLIGLTL